MDQELPWLDKCLHGIGRYTSVHSCAAVLVREISHRITDNWQVYFCLFHERQLDQPWFLCSEDMQYILRGLDSLVNPA